MESYRNSIDYQAQDRYELFSQNDVCDKNSHSNKKFWLTTLQIFTTSLLGGLSIYSAIRGEPEEATKLGFLAAYSAYMLRRK